MQDPPIVKKASSNLPLVLLAPVGRMNSSVSWKHTIIDKSSAISLSENIV